jgi:elongation factor G
MGQVHVEVAVEKLKRKFEVEVHLELPHPAYQETLGTSAKGYGRCKRHNAGRGLFGECRLELSPLPRGSGVVFEDALARGALPRNFVPAVEAGVREAARSGPLGGFPLVDFKARLVGGAFHVVDSSEDAFRIAGALALKHALPAACPLLLEPIMRLEVVAPDELLAEVIGDLTSRRGKVVGVESASRGTLVRALAPQAELRTYALELRALTKGAGYFTMELAAFETVPTHEAHRVLAARHAEQGRGQPVPNHPRGRA